MMAPGLKEEEEEVEEMMELLWRKERKILV